MIQIVSSHLRHHHHQAYSTAFASLDHIRFDTAWTCKYSHLVTVLLFLSHVASHTSGCCSHYLNLFAAVSYWPAVWRQRKATGDPRSPARRRSDKADGNARTRFFVFLANCDLPPHLCPLSTPTQTSTCTQYVLILYCIVVQYLTLISPPMLLSITLLAIATMTARRSFSTLCRLYDGNQG